MDPTEQFATLMEREVSRIEFIKYVGVAFVGMLGITAFLRNLHHNVPNHAVKSSFPKNSTMSSSPGGYGGSAYGR